MPSVATRPTSCAVTVIAPGDPLLPFGQFTLCRACGDETACVAARYLTLRIVRERHEGKNPLPFSFSQRSPVSGLHQIILGKGRKSEGGNHWRLPSCAPAGEAGFSRFASENPNFWNDNENPLKRRTIALANSACSFEQTCPNPCTRDSDAKYKTKTEDVPVHRSPNCSNRQKKRAVLSHSSSKIYFSRYTFAYCTPSSFARSWVLTAMSILLPLIAPPVSSAMNTP